MALQLFVGLGAAFIFAAVMFLAFPKLAPSDNASINDRMIGMGIIFLALGTSFGFGSVVLAVFF